MCVYAFSLFFFGYDCNGNCSVCENLKSLAHSIFHIIVFVCVFIYCVLIFKFVVLKQVKEGLDELRAVTIPGTSLQKRSPFSFPSTLIVIN